MRARTGWLLLALLATAAGAHAAPDRDKKSDSPAMQSEKSQIKPAEERSIGATTKVKPKGSDQPAQSDAS